MIKYDLSPYYKNITVQILHNKLTVKDAVMQTKSLYYTGVLSFTEYLQISYFIDPHCIYRDVI